MGSTRLHFQKCRGDIPHDLFSSSSFDRAIGYLVFCWCFPLALPIISSFTMMVDCCLKMYIVHVAQYFRRNSDLDQEQFWFEGRIEEEIWSVVQIVLKINSFPRSLGRLDSHLFLSISWWVKSLYYRFGLFLPLPNNRK